MLMVNIERIISKLTTRNRITLINNWIKRKKRRNINLKSLFKSQIQNNNNRNNKKIKSKYLMKLREKFLLRRRKKLLNWRNN